MPKIDGALLDPSDMDTGRMESRPPDQLPTAAISTALPKRLRDRQIRTDLAAGDEARCPVGNGKDAAFVLADTIVGMTDASVRRRG
jgi:hypothetical protein